jgi:hypothetical protein
LGCAKITGVVNRAVGKTLTAKRRFEQSQAEAEAAQQRAMEANAKIEQIVEAIRTQLPSRENLSAPN